MLKLGDNVVQVPNSSNAQSYLSFKDANTQAWYLLMRDTNDNNDRIIASFCRWDINYYKTEAGKI
ncbi:MAG: hypothetical protein K2I49_02785 [Ureaplasma sp.]|nr:hypothetical protein [Ureaplasma sp.]